MSEMGDRLQLKANEQKRQNTQTTIRTHVSVAAAGIVWLRKTAHDKREEGVTDLVHSQLL